jgi:hypothetical protein
MAIVRSNAFPGTVFNPRLPRQSSTSPARTMRGIVLAPRLRQFPNGEPLGRALGEFVAAPELQQFPNGRPLRANLGPVLVDKQSLVKASLKRVMSKRCGMGDDGTDTTVFQDPTYADSNPAGTPPPPDVYNPSAGNVIPNYNAAAGEYNTPSAAVAAGASPMDTIAGGTPAASPTSTLTNVLSKLFGSTPAGYRPQTGASGFAYNLGAGLQQPIYAGSPITNGGVLLAGGLLLFLFMAVSGKKR